MSDSCAKPRGDVIRLLVADESLMSCQLLIGALKRCRGIAVVARVTSSDQILAEVRNTHPNVALISGNLQDGSLSGFGAVRQLRKLHSEVRTILLLNSADGSWAIDAFRAGAKGIFCRDHSVNSLCKCIHAVHLGQIWARSHQLESVLDAFARVAPPGLVEGNAKISLSRRENEVAELVAEGQTNRKIAQQLGLSEHTVKNYLFHIFDKLGISSRVELVLYAHALEKNSERAREDSAGSSRT